MSKKVRKALSIGLGCISLLFSFAPVLRGQTVSPVPTLDLNHFVGTWYEIARFPNKRQKKCVSDAVMLIARGDKDKQIQFVSSCETKSQYAEVKNGKGKAQDKSGDGKLKVSYMWPFSSQYWVIALDPEYKWSLIASSNHKNLWILSRTPELSPEVLAEVEAKAKAEGFATENLVMTRQTAP